METPAAATDTRPNEESRPASLIAHATTAAPETPPKVTRSLRFWLVFASLCLAAFAASLNATVVSTVLPTIVRDLDGEAQYIWVASSYAIAATAIQPMCGQMSNIFGRRTPMLLSIATFALGGGISGGANSMTMLIAGRTVQGLGGGGILMLMEVITCDLLPLRERSKYLSVILSACSLGVTLGPTIGGAFASRGAWRWTFYVSVPIAALALVVTALFLRLQYRREPTWKAALLRADFLGNFIFIASTCSIMVGLVMGGAVFPWSSWRVILPIVLGGCGWVVFQVHQSSRFCREPIMPLRLFSNRTACTGFVLVFISCMLLDWTTYFIPFYFQALKGYSALTSGVDTLPFNAFLIPAAGISGGLLYKFGQYKPLHAAGFACYALAAGLFSTMDANTTRVEWVFWQIFAAFGLGSLVTCTLPAIQASLSESDVATSVGTHAFLRSFGFVWGFTIPSIILNNLVNANIDIIQDPSVRAAIANGGAYAQADSNLFSSLTGAAREQTLQVYTDALHGVWYAAAAFSLIGFLAVFVEKRIELRTTLETEFGLEERSRTTDEITAEKGAASE
ncbi:hypothetical protein MMC17_003318 [Xylographa soralifera]|nr:hypothetical protein [Xylographa soralifera]